MRKTRRITGSRKRLDVKTWGQVCLCSDLHGHRRETKDQHGASRSRGGRCNFKTNDMRYYTAWLGPCVDFLLFLVVVLEQIESIDNNPINRSKDVNGAAC